MDTRVQMTHDMNNLNDHHTFGIAEKVIMSIQNLIHAQ